MKTTRRFFLLLASVGIALLSASAIAQAQRPAIGITPASMDVAVKRGSTYTQVFTLTNGSANRFVFKCSVADVWYDENNERVAGPAGTLPRSAGLWLQFSALEVIVEAHSFGTVKAIVTVPPGASGSYYAVPVFEGMPAPSVSASLIKSTASTASMALRFRGLMEFTITDAANYRVDIMGGEVTPPTGHSELALRLDVFNRGTTQARIRGSFALLRADGTLAGRGTMVNTRYMPGQRKNALATWAGELPHAGQYTCVISLNYDRVGAETVTLIHEIPFEMK